MALSKLQIKMADGKLVAALNGLDITSELMGIQFTWRNGEAPVALLAVAVPAGDLDLFANVTKEVAGTVPPADDFDPPPPPHEEGTDPANA